MVSLREANGGLTGRALARSQVGGLLTAIAVWEIAGRLLHFAFLPPFSDVALASWRMITSGLILGSLGASLASLLAGYGLAAALGIVTGLLMGRYRQIEYLLDIYVNALLATPSLIFVPVLFALFGVSRASQVAVVFLYAFAIVVIHTMSGVRSSDATLVEMGRAFGASERQLFWKVILPGALPQTMTGLRVAMGRAVKGMINGEMFIALVGLGALIRTYGSRFDATRVLAVLLVVVVVAQVAITAVQMAGEALTRWVSD